MNTVTEFVERIPFYVAGPTLVVLAIAITLLVRKSLREGREVSFWPPKIGARPPDSEKTDVEFSEEEVKPTEGRIRRVRLPVDQIGYLSLIAGEGIGTAWPITAGDREIRVGRSPESDVCIRPEDLCLSVSHFKIYVKPIEGLHHRGYQFFVHDTGSANGTFVNGTKVGYEPYEVADNDTIEAGSCKFMIHITAGHSQTVDMTGGQGQTILRKVDE